MTQFVVPQGGFIRDLLLVQLKKLVLDKWTEFTDAIRNGDATKLEEILAWIESQLGIKFSLLMFITQPLELWRAIQSGNGATICQEISDVALVAKGFFNDPNPPMVAPGTPGIRLPMLASSGDSQADMQAAFTNYEVFAKQPMRQTGSPDLADNQVFVPEAIAFITLILNVIRFIRDRRKPTPTP